MDQLTPGARALKQFIGDDKSRSQRFLADELSVSQPSVSAWIRGTARPEAHYRAAIEILTGIPAADWQTDEERMVVERVVERVRAQHAPGRNPTANDFTGPLAPTGTEGR